MDESTVREEVEYEINEIKNQYIGTVHRLNSDNNSAETFTQDYSGRQIYELLQNAEDQVQDDNGKVKIVLEGNKLTVANTGLPFSADGFISILYICDSSKEHESHKTIGYKGIGFRSVLNWTDDITIYSNGLKLHYSKNEAEKCFEEIINRVKNKEQYLRKYKKGNKTPVPILVCPHIDSSSIPLDGYDTVLEFICFNNIIENVKSQLSELKPEVLLFLTKLKEISITIDGVEKTFICKKDSIEKQKLLYVQDSTNTEIHSIIYNYFSEEGFIDNKYYEISIGYDRLNKSSGEVLYSYFKTNVKMTFPAYVHATFELTSNRNELLPNNIYNIKLTEKLVDKLIDTALHISNLNLSKKYATYEPLELLMAEHNDIPNEYNFNGILKEKLKTKKIIPTISEEYVSLDSKPFFANHNLITLLKPESFPNVVKKCNSAKIETFLEELDFVSYKEFVEILNKDILLHKYNWEEKCKLIYEIRKYNQFNTSYTGEGLFLFEDSKNTIVKDVEKIFPLPESQKISESLPSWADVRFLSARMLDYLGKLSNFTLQRNLISHYEKFGLDEYNFSSLLRVLIHELKEIITNEEVINDEEENAILELLNWIFYSGERPDLKSQSIRVPVICRNRTIKYASEVYIGKEYGNLLGERLVSIYSNSFLLYNELKLPT